MVYSQFRGLVDQGKVASARFDDSSQRVYFELRPEYLRQVKTAAGDLAWPEGAFSATNPPPLVALVERKFIPVCAEVEVVRRGSLATFFGLRALGLHDVGTLGGSGGGSDAVTHNPELRTQKDSRSSRAGRQRIAQAGFKPCACQVTAGPSV